MAIMQGIATKDAEMDYRSFTDVVIERQKLLDYLLSPTHNVGQCKAEFFQLLGYHQLTWMVLERDIRGLLVPDVELVPAGDTSHGVKYTVSGQLVGPNGRAARVLTVWIVRPAHSVLRFVTAYPEGAANEH